jgi:predicted RNA-binding Zn-ribbon protein involved in translation (DUF1610 family)
MSHKVSLNVSCPHCRKPLKDQARLISNHPAIKLNIKLPDGKESLIWLSSIYGDFNYSCEVPISDETIVEFYCPHCGNRLIRKNVECDDCGAPIVSFLCSVGGRVSICSRNGCKKHYFVFDDIDTALRKFYTEYESY